MYIYIYIHTYLCILWVCLKSLENPKDPAFDVGTWLAQLLGAPREDNSTELPAVLRALGDLGLKGSFAPLK